MVDAHDTLFRAAFQHLHTVRALLAWLLPTALRAAVLAGNLQPWPSAAADRGLRLHDADLMFVLRLTPRICILFVLEHKSWADTKLLRQLHRYVTHLTQAWKPENGDFAFVVPVIVYHGRRQGWQLRWSHRLRELPDDIRLELEQFLPRLQVVFDDLTSCSEAELMQRPLPAMARLCLLCLRFLRDATEPFVEAAMARWAPLFLAAADEPGGQELVAAVSSYLLHVTEVPAEKVVELFCKYARNPDPEFIMSTASRLRAEGRVEGRAEVLLTLLETKFGQVPAATRRRIAAATLEELDRWARRVLTATTLDAVLHD